MVGEILFVIEEALGPVHQRVDVFRRGQLRGPFVLYTVLPEILVSVQITVSISITHHLSDGYLGPADMIGHCDSAGRFNKVDLRYGRHRTWTYLLGSTEFGYRAVKHIQMVEEVDGYPTEMGKWIGSMRLDTLERTMHG